MRILTLGGTSFIGAATVRRLKQLGHEVASFSRRAVEDPGRRHWRGDRAELERFMPEIRAFAPEVVIDFIAFAEDDALQLARLFAGVAARAVVISSCDVYRAYDRVRNVDPGPADPTPLTEDSPLRSRLFPFHDPARDLPEPAKRYEKILVERALMAQTALPWTVLRLPMVYGPGDPQHRIASYLKRMDDRRLAILLERGIAAWRACRGYVEDMAQAVVLCATDERATRRIYHVAEPALDEAGWVARVARAAAWDGRVVPMAAALLPAHLRDPHIKATAQDWSLDSSRIRAELGYAETLPPQEAMERTVAWERQHPAAVRPEDFAYADEDAALRAVSGAP